MIIKLNINNQENLSIKSSKNIKILKNIVKKEPTYPEKLISNLWSRNEKYWFSCSKNKWIF